MGAVRNTKESQWHLQRQNASGRLSRRKLLAEQGLRVADVQGTRVGASACGTPLHYRI